MSYRTNHAARPIVLRRLAWQAYESGNAGDVARIRRDIDESARIVRRDRAPVEFPPAPGSVSLRVCGRVVV
ncbi:hypothetical protein [Gluconacetobacter diazotrophicus]|uniref:hypothetical protein n=1 Tax=Gluconacetobacter diazotrophicus TaxID=33996 RepID=UPI00119A80E3|nr:hypothetical protein [Gluconacetobacter diazotrophicus]TWB00395.1 hypothetical protein FBZ86_1379 [Gluconacetobacter diazotrophicus]